MLEEEDESIRFKEEIKDYNKQLLT